MIYNVCFIHPLHISMAFYFEMYFSGILGLILFLTSTNYWKKPYTNSIARTIDVVCVHIIIPHQYYLSLFTANKLLCTGLMSVGILMYPLSNYFQNKNIKVSAFCHCAMHICISISLCFMYQDYYANKRTITPPSQDELALDQAFTAFLLRT